MRARTVVFVCLLIGGIAACADGSSSDDDSAPDARDLVCGDGICDVSELYTCAADCGTPQACDNDGVCEGGETPANCATDCTQQVTCDNDGVCDAGETVANCPNDCGGGPVCDFDGICEAGAGEVAGSCADCTTGGTCDMDFMCEMGEDTTCLDCLLVCNNNGVCDPPFEIFDMTCVDCYPP